MRLHDLSVERIDRLNSATKYPSIPTYHVMGERGRLTDELAVTFDDGEELVTEKVDGTNTRIVWLPSGDYLVGSREEFLYAKGDLLRNPQLGIVDALWMDLGRILRADPPFGAVVVLYGETYGGNINDAKQYTGERATGLRIFDAMRMDIVAMQDLLNTERRAIALWREHDGQRFCGQAELAMLAEQLVLDLVPKRVHPLATPLPTSLGGCLLWLREVLEDGTAVALDPGALGRAEGVVVRNADRSKIVKLRIEDYERTLRPAKK